MKVSSAAEMGRLDKTAVELLGMLTASAIVAPLKKASCCSPAPSVCPRHHPLHLKHGIMS